MGHDHHQHPRSEGQAATSVWHDEAHDGILEHASLRLTGGAISLFVNVGIELDGRFSARVETLGQVDEVTGLADGPTAKRRALERARQVLGELTAALEAVEAHQSESDR